MIKCDKCEQVFNPYNTRRVTIVFGEGPAGDKGQYEYKGKTFPAVIMQDLCTDCWLEFIEDTLDSLNLDDNYNIWEDKFSF